MKQEEIWLVRKLPGNSNMSSLTSLISLKLKSSQAISSGNSTTSNAIWYRPVVSTKLLLANLITFELYLNLFKMLNWYSLFTPFRKNYSLGYLHIENSSYQYYLPDGDLLCFLRLWRGALFLPRPLSRDDMFRNE